MVTPTATSLVRVLVFGSIAISSLLQRWASQSPRLTLSPLSARRSTRRNRPEQAPARGCAKNAACVAHVAWTAPCSPPSQAKGHQRRLKRDRAEMGKEIHQRRLEEFPFGEVLVGLGPLFAATPDVVGALQEAGIEIERDHEIDRPPHGGEARPDGQRG